MNQFFSFVSIFSDETSQHSSGIDLGITSSQVSSAELSQYEYNESNLETFSEADQEDDETQIDVDQLVQQLNSMESEIITSTSRDDQRHIPTSPSIKYAPSIQQGKPISFPTYWSEMKAQSLSYMESERLESIEAENRDRRRNRLLKAICIEWISCFGRRGADEEGESMGSGRRWWTALRRTRTEEENIPRSHNVVQKVCSVLKTCFWISHTLNGSVCYIEEKYLYDWRGSVPRFFLYDNVKVSHIAPNIHHVVCTSFCFPTHPETISQHPTTKRTPIYYLTQIKLSQTLNISSLYIKFLPSYYSFSTSRYQNNLHH